MSAAEGGWGWGHGEQLALRRVKGIWVEVVLGTADTQQAKGLSNSAPQGGGDALLSQGKSRVGDGCPGHSERWLLSHAASHECAWAAHRDAPWENQSVPMG